MTTDPHVGPQRGRAVRTAASTIKIFVAGFVLFVVVCAGAMIAWAVLSGTGEGTEENPDGGGLLNDRIAVHG